MLLTAELLLYHQRCDRRAFLDVYGDPNQQDPPSGYLLKLIQDSLTHRRAVLKEYTYEQPKYPSHDWQAGAEATLELMRQGVDCIHRGVLLAEESGVMLLSRPDLLMKQPGLSEFGDWLYVPAEIKLGKRPKLEYQVIAAFDVQVLAAVQGAWPETAWLLLREKGAYSVDLWKLIPQMQTALAECIQTLKAETAPEVFIARNRCSLCSWYSHCYEIAQSEQHLSLLPGVTSNRYVQLKAHNFTTIESLAHTTPTQLATLPGFGPETAQKLVLQAQATLRNQAISRLVDCSMLLETVPSATVELYFDIEAEPDLNLAFLLGVLVVDRQAQTETFHVLLAEKPEEEAAVWQDFLALVKRYPEAPIFHFCPYEAQTVERLAQLYKTPAALVRPLLSRFVDLHDEVTQAVILPVESYALKPIARWLGFDWRDPNANGAQAICWYADWLSTGDRTCLDAIVSYNEDDCRAMLHIKDWLVQFGQNAQLESTNFFALEYLTNLSTIGTIEIASNEGL